MLDKLDASVADPGDAPFERYADLGQTPKDRIRCRERNLHVPWVRAIRERERQRHAVIEYRQEFIGNRSRLNGRPLRQSSRRLPRTAIDPASRNWGMYLGFLAIGADAITRRHRCVPS